MKSRKVTNACPESEIAIIALLFHLSAIIPAIGVIIICGKNDHVDEFIDLLYEKSSKFNLDDIQIESYFKEKDYRGVFRVIA